MMRPVPAPPDPQRLLAYANVLGASAKHALRWASHHTGIPVVVVAAVALVVSFRVFKRSVRLAVEVAIALALVIAATKLGWVTW
jgi:hypothetical protein